MDSLRLGRPLTAQNRIGRHRRMGTPARISRDRSDQISSYRLEEGDEILLDFTRVHSSRRIGVLPVVVQEIITGDVLMVAYADETAVSRTLRDRVATFWSLTRDELWVKGLQSGNVLDVHEVRVNCEQNSLLYACRLRRRGACHTTVNGVARRSCYYRMIKGSRLVHTD